MKPIAGSKSFAFVVKQEFVILVLFESNMWLKGCKQTSQFG